MKQYAIAIKLAGYVAAPGMATYDNAEGDNGWYLDKRSSVPRLLSMMSHPWQSYISALKCLFEDADHSFGLSCLLLRRVMEMLSQERGVPWQNLLSQHVGCPSPSPTR